MEITCNRCHQAVPADSCFCPTCGLPQIVYSNEDGGGPAQAERWNEAVRDASAVEWRPALRVAMLLAVPAGLLSCGFSPVAILGLFWMAAAAILAVTLYVRRQRPAWITMGAGARIGLVTGLIAGWFAFGATGLAFFCMRYWFHQGQGFDQMWQSTVNQSLNQQLQAMNENTQALNAFRDMLLSPEGRAGIMLTGMVILEVPLLVFAAAGGALGARLMARARRPGA
ncbi:MAG TPA: zinc ribbon domain-containing protein [Terracidiphilus sp.]|nr:zinc ribbon domain-containing protein [Bryobacteraceae bacterium]HKF47455.1 zinc ribbon domain-containing protein [Terracidiphilus sp.]